MRFANIGGTIIIYLGTALLPYLKRLHLVNAARLKVAPIKQPLPSEKAIKLPKQPEQNNFIVTIFLAIFAPYAMMHLLENKGALK